MDKRFPVSTFWEMAREKEITAFNYMGALLMMLHKQPDRPDDADNPIRIAFGAPCPVEIWEAVRAPLRRRARRGVRDDRGADGAARTGSTTAGSARPAASR